MALVLGTEYCKLDSNGRFKLPIVFKKQLEDVDLGFSIRAGFTSECLELWTVSSFQVELEGLLKKLNSYNIEDNKILHRMTATSVVYLDNSDRMIIPPERKSVIGDTKEIVLQGTGRYIEIWNRSAYEKMFNEISDFASVVDKRLGRLHELPSAGDAE